MDKLHERIRECAYNSFDHPIVSFLSPSLSLSSPFPPASCPSLTACVGEFPCCTLSLPPCVVLRIASLFLMRSFCIALSELDHNAIHSNDAKRSPSKHALQRGPFALTMHRGNNECVPTVVSACDSNDGATPYVCFSLFITLYHFVSRSLCFSTTLFLYHFVSLSITLYHFVSLSITLFLSLSLCFSFSLCF